MVDDLRTFLTQLAGSPGDRTLRLVFADWLDEHHPASPVRACDHMLLPKGFNRWWHRAGHAKTYRHRRADFEPSTWSNWVIRCVIDDIGRVAGGSRGWLDHIGETTYETPHGPLSPLVSEPYMDEEDALAVAETVQTALGVPVSYSRRAYHHPMCCRIAVWWAFISAAGAED